MSRLVLARRTRQGHVAEGSGTPWDSKAEAIFTRQFSVKCSETKLQWRRNYPSASDLSPRLVGDSGISPRCIIQNEGLTCSEVSGTARDVAPKPCGLLTPVPF